MQYLNWYYLGKNFPTNVLSFPFEPPLGIQSSLIGDIVLCKQIVEYEEANQKNISRYTHWVHMVVHGSLHLLGYDHILEKDAILMQKLENNIMIKIGYNICCNLAND